jgi:quercetin dioxygenase-like cupin family protein
MHIFTIDRASAQDATASGNFGGQVWVQRLITEEQSQDIELLVVSFEPGGQTRPHIHAVDQILQIVSGRGIVATGSERRFVEPGDEHICSINFLHFR